MSSSSNNISKKIKARGADAITAICGSSMASANNMPMLSSIAERYASLLPFIARQAGLPNITAEDHSVQTLRYGEAIDDLPSYCIAAVASVPEMRSQMVLSIEGEFVKRVIHFMLGGKGSDADVDRKVFTRIDKSIASKLMEKILFAFSEAFSPVLKIAPKVDSVDSHAQFATLLSRVAPAIVFRVKLTCDDVSGVLNVVVPRAALDPIKESLSTMVVDGSETEGHWVSDLKNTTSNAPIFVNAVMATFDIPLSDVLEWKVGSTFELPPIGLLSTELVTSESTLARGRAGVYNGRKGVVLKEVNTNQENVLIGEHGAELK